MTATSRASDGARLRLGVAGLGAVAQVVHLPLVQRRSDLFAVSAVCDVSSAVRDAVGDRYGVPGARRYPDLGAMLGDGGLDAVLLLTSGSHGAAARAILDQGLAVLCEKPLAYTLAEADDLDKATATDAAPRLLLGYMKQYDPAVRRLVDLLPPQETIRAVDVTVLHPSSESQLAFAGPLSLALDVEPPVVERLRADEAARVREAIGEVPVDTARLYADVLLGSVIHDLSLFRTIVGSPVQVDGVDVWPDGAWPPSLSATGQLPQGVRFHVGWHYLPSYPAYRETVVVHHEHGSLELVFAAPYLLNAPTRLTVVELVDGHERRAAYGSVTEAFEEELVAFHAMVTAGTPPLSSTAEGRADIVTCQRILRRYAEQAGIELGGEAGEA